MAPREERPARPLTQGVGKGLPIKISNGICGEGGVVQRSLQREKDSGDSGK